MISRDEIVLEYLEKLPYPPYPVQEEAMLAWADEGSAEGGVLLSAPTGTGKTMVAELVMYEALKLGKEAYYSTPLIALTDQKFLELQATVERWGYSKDQVGLVTGNRTVNGDAPLKVVVAEVLLNRLLHREAFDFTNVSGVVMDEFHNFNEPQRGIVWELALSLLPANVRVMLLSATIGAAHEFTSWMTRSLGRNVRLVEGKERKVPLSYQWVGDELLPDFMEKIAAGVEDRRRTPALVFCFDRSVCWDVAEVLKGKDLFGDAAQRQALLDKLETYDFKVGVGNKLRTFLTRGVGIHHAGLLPRYRRVVEELFQAKLLPVCVCTETLAAGLNLPARSVVLTTLVKGPKDKKKLIDASSAQQIFGRAGRPQFDKEGNVYALAHEDDVKLARWQEKYDSIPETEKDPKLMSAKKALLKKKPTRRTGFTYWNPEQFTKLQVSPPHRLESKGRLTWRWIAYLLELNPDVESIRAVVRRRLMDQPTIAAELKRVTRMLVTLHQLGVVTLTPPPPPSWTSKGQTPSTPAPTTTSDETKSEEDGEEEVPLTDLLGRLKLGGGVEKAKGKEKAQAAVEEPYEPVRAEPTDKLKLVTAFRAIHPLYGLWLQEYLGMAEEWELIQILESLLEMPGTVARMMRVPRPEDLPPGKLATEVIDPALITRGIAAQEDLYPPADQSDIEPELRKYPIPLADKMKMLFESEIDHAGGLFITPVWGAGDLLARSVGFDQYVRARDMLKQEGVLFKHLLRMVLLCGEMEAVVPRGVLPEVWRDKLRALADRLEEVCREVDPASTDELLEELAE